MQNILKKMGGHGQMVIQICKIAFFFFIGPLPSPPSPLPLLPLSKAATCWRVPY